MYHQSTWSSALSVVVLPLILSAQFTVQTLQTAGCKQPITEGLSEVWMWLWS